MKKVVLKLDYTDEKMKAKAMQKVSGIHGLESIALDAKDKKLTVIGDIDPVSVVGKLRKVCRHTEILSVGPAKEPEKKKEEPKKEEPKKEEPKKAEEKKPDAPKPDQAQLLKAYQAHLLQQQQQQQLQLLHQQQMYQYNQQRQHFQQSQAPNPTNYFNRSVEEDPNGCVIC